MPFPHLLSIFLVQTLAYIPCLFTLRGVALLCKTPFLDSGRGDECYRSRSPWRTLQHQGKYFCARRKQAMIQDLKVQENGVEVVSLAFCKGGKMFSLDFFL